MTIPANNYYDAIILGAGQAAVPLASALSAKGKRTAMIEQAAVGGTCVNYGCTPTKTMVASAEVAHMARRAQEYGIKVTGVSVEMVAVRERKRGMVTKWREGSEKRLQNAKFVDLIYGEGSFLGPKEVRVRLKHGGERTLTADLIVIDTGLTVNVPPIKGLADVPYLDNVSVMELSEVPEHLLVLGGGYIGLEFAQMFRRFGSRVTVIHSGKQLLSGEDSDIADEITAILRDEGIDILLEAKTETATGSGKNIRLRVKLKEGDTEVSGSHLLVATGRRPNTDKLNLPAAGIATNERGFIKVNDRLESSVQGVYAVGDVNGGPAFTHVSYDDFRVLQTNLLEGGNRSVSRQDLSLLRIYRSAARTYWAKREGGETAREEGAGCQIAHDFRRARQRNRADAGFYEGLGRSVDRPDFRGCSAGRGWWRDYVLDRGWDDGQAQILGFAERDLCPSPICGIS